MKRKNKSKIESVQTPREQLESQFKALLSEEEYRLLSDEIDKPLSPAIRLNPLKTQTGFSRRLEAKYGWALEPIPYCAEGFTVDPQKGPSVSSTLEHRMGMYYIQEAASMLPVELFQIEQQDDGLSLDLAASPGGKTTHLLSRVKDRGMVLANDSSQGRIHALRIVLQNWGAVGNAVSRFPGESFGTWFPEVFDRVLLDAPCSMQGLRTAESHSARPVTDKESHQLALRQTALLTSALRTVKIGGEVVYSTCTLMPEENEGVVDNILTEYKGAVQILNAHKILPTPAPGITNAVDRQYLTELNQSIRFWPHRYHTAGFFACILQKTQPFNQVVSSWPTNSMEKAGFIRFSPAEESAFSAIIQGNYGYDLGHYLAEFNRVLVGRDDKVFLFPIQIFVRLAGLPLQSAGLLIGENMPDGFLPSHEWVSRFGNQAKRNKLILDEEQSNNWIRGNNLSRKHLSHVSDAVYQIIIGSDGIALGRGKNVGEEIKNLLPRRLVSN